MSAAAQDRLSGVAQFVDPRLEVAPPLCRRHFLEGPVDVHVHVAMRPGLPPN